MHHRPTREKPYKRNMKRSWKIPRTRCNVSFKKSCGGQRYHRLSRRRKRVGTRDKNTWAVGGKWPKKRRRSWHSTPSPQQQRPKVQNLRTAGQSISGEDITSCQRLHYGAYIGNETRSLEFKTGSGHYMQCIFCKDVGIYGCAFLNSGGGSLLVGVYDSGVVCGVHFSHNMEDKTRLQVDWIVKRFNPPLLSHNYSLHFLPVIKPGVEEHHLKVLRLTFRKTPAFTDPTLYQIDREVYVRLDGSVQGPLGASVILEWSRQMWTDKVQQLEQCVREATAEKRVLTGRINRLIQSINTLHQIIASLQPQRAAPSSRCNCKVTEDLELSARQSSGSSTSLPSVGPPDATPAHTGDLDRTLKSEHGPM